MLMMASIIRVGQSNFVTLPIDEDSSERILNCIQTLAQLSTSAPAQSIFLSDTKAAYTAMVSAESAKAAAAKAKEKKEVAIQADDLIPFRQFQKVKGEEDDLEKEMERAQGGGEIREDFVGKLKRVVQLTGFSDPVYAEAYVNVHQFDILLGTVHLSPYIYDSRF